MGGRLDHDEVVVDHDGAAGLGEAGGQRGQTAGCPPAHGAVVGVAHRHRPVREDRDAEGVLQQRDVRGAVLQAEVEQARADGGVHDAVLDVAQARGLAVHHPQPVAGRREPGGLREPRLVERAVEQALVGRAGRHLAAAGARVERPELVDAGHRDPHAVLPPHHVPRARQRRRPGAGEPLPAVPGDGPDVAVGQPHPAERVVHGVGHHDVVPDLDRDVRGQPAQAVRLVEARLDGRTVGEAALPRPDPPHDRPAVLGQLDELVVSGVCDEEALPRKGDRLRREPEVTRRHGRRHVGRPGRLQRSPAAVLRSELAHQRLDGVRVTLPGVLRDHVSLRVDEHQRRPGTRGVGLPRHEVRVVEHRVPDAVPLDRRAHRSRVGLVLELRRVHPDHDELTVVPLLQRPQLVEDVQAVHAAEGPEVQQQEASAEVRDGVRRPAGVEPATAVELGGADARSSGGVGHAVATPRDRAGIPPDPTGCVTTPAMSRDPRPSGSGSTVREPPS